MQSRVAAFFRYQRRFSLLRIPLSSQGSTDINSRSTSLNIPKQTIPFRCNNRSFHILTTKHLNLSSTSIKFMSSSSSFPVTANLKAKLTDAFQPSHLEIINESYMHNVPPESESHFKVVIVSSQFETAKTPLARHRMVNKVLCKELAPPNEGGTVHALSIVAKTPAQWGKMVQNSDGKGVVIERSPSCRGGDGSLPSKIQ